MQQLYKHNKRGTARYSIKIKRRRASERYLQIKHFLLLLIIALNYRQSIIRLSSYFSSLFLLGSLPIVLVIIRNVIYQ